MDPIPIITLLIYTSAQIVLFICLLKSYRQFNPKIKKLTLKITIVIYSILNLLVIIRIIFHKPLLNLSKKYYIDPFLHISLLIATLLTIPIISIILYHLLKLISKTIKHKIRNPITIVTAITIILYIAGFILYQKRYDFEVVKISINFKTLPKEFNNYKIVHLSDFHSSYFVREKYLNKIVNTVNNLNPNLIVLTGDYLTSNKNYFHELITALSKLNKKVNKIAVLGNHDLWVDPIFIEKELNLINIKVLRNSNYKISKNNQSIYIVGIDDLFNNHDNINKAIKNIDLNKFTILLCHNPDFIKTAVNYSFDLMLSGHTHGGQIKLPIIGPITLPSKLDNKYTEGLLKKKNTYLYINKGIGVISPPIRFLSPPEISEITLKKEV